jgi:hypothetical protein
MCITPSKSGLSLFNFHGSVDVTLGDVPFSYDTDVFNLVSIYGHTAVRVGNGTLGHADGSLYIIGGDFTGSLSSHESWNVGNSVVTDGGYMTLGGGFFSGNVLVKNGATLLEGGGSAGGAYTVNTLEGGTYITTGWGGGTVTFLSQTRQHPDQVLFKGSVASSATMDRNDLLQAGGGQVVLHNFTGQPLQVDQTAAGVSVIADAAPHPGMIPLNLIG